MARLNPTATATDAWVAKIGFGAAAPTPSPTPSPSPPSGQPLPAPALLSPANDARFQPGATVTLDWADVASAATSYTIQIDDSDTFQAPFTVELTVAASQHTASGLPTRRMWWWVRANTSGGVPGNWSQIRRLELKN